MQVKTIVLGPFQTNCYILHCEETREAAIIDPAEESSQIIDYLAKHQLALKYILLTHAHIDHIGGVAWLKKKFACPVFLHEADLPILKSSPEFAAMLGLKPTRPFTPEIIRDSEIPLGKMELEILHTPGHTPGGVSYLCEKSAFVGDTLFAQSIGRTDLTGGNYKKLIDSIHTKLLILEDSVIVYPGHGPDTTIGFERLHNPFLN